MLNRYVSTILLIFFPSCFADFIMNTLLYIEKIQLHASTVFESYLIILLFIMNYT